MTCKFFKDSKRFFIGGHEITTLGTMYWKLSKVRPKSAVFIYSVRPKNGFHFFYEYTSFQGIIR